MRIKLPKDIAECVKSEHAIQTEIIQLSTAAFEMSERFWKALREKYKGFNFAGAKIENETGELILPFEDDKGSQRSNLLADEVKA